MKKLFLSFIEFCTFIPLSAQDGYVEFVPTNQGAKTYDAKGNLLGTMTYKIALFH